MQTLHIASANIKSVINNYMKINAVIKMLAFEHFKIKAVFHDLK